jgi:membrane-bound metal-dependent hydrolase YbcI (DUF457 family)
VFVGHGLVAFTGVAAVGSALGFDRRHALALGVCAAAFGTAPDIDIVYAPVGAVEALRGGSDPVVGFWGQGNVIHRAVTHSLPVAVCASFIAGAAGYYARSNSVTGPLPGADHRPAEITTGTRRLLAALVAVGIAAGLVGVAGVASGPLGVVVMGLFVAVVGAIAVAGTRHGLTAREIAVGALVGIASHPFGDLLTGTPPAFGYPFDVTLIADRVVLIADPTLNLLGVFGIELATVWLAAAVYGSLSGYRLRQAIDWRAALGIAYAGAALAIPAPTLESSYQFVVSVLAVGVVVGISPAVRPYRRSNSNSRSGSPLPSVQRSGQEANATEHDRKPGEVTTEAGGVERVRAASGRCGRLFNGAMTSLAAITLALLAYTVTYTVMF